MYWVLLFLKQESLAWNVLVTVDVAEEVAVVVCVVVEGLVVTDEVPVDDTDDVAVVVIVVQSQLRYAPLWYSEMARFSTLAVVAHLAPPSLLSFKNPSGLHSMLPKSSPP